MKVLCTLDWVAEVFTAPDYISHYVNVETGEEVDSFPSYESDYGMVSSPKRYAGSSADGCAVLLTAEDEDTGMSEATVVDVRTGTYYQVGAPANSLLSPDGTLLAWTEDEVIDGSHNETPLIIDFRHSSAATSLPGQYSGLGVMTGFTPQSELLVRDFYEGYLEYHPSTSELKKATIVDPGPWNQWYFPTIRTWARDVGQEGRLEIEALDMDGKTKRIYSGTQPGQSVTAYPWNNALLISGLYDNQVCQIDDGSCVKFGEGLESVDCTLIGSETLVCAGYSGEADRAVVFDLATARARPLSNQLAEDVSLLEVGPVLRLTDQSEAGE